MYKTLILFAFAITSFFSNAANIYDITGDEPLNFKQAFSFSEQSEGSKLIINIDAVKGHYLYTESVEVKINNINVNPNQITFGPTKTKEDEFYGVSEVIVGQSNITIELNSTRTTSVKMKIQGCSSQGICYMPQTYEFKFIGQEAETATNVEMSDASQETTHILFYFIIGLLIAFTPCTYPLITITINAFGKNKLVSASAYVAGLTIAFTTIGLLVITFGATILPLINSSILNIVISIVFALLGLSLLFDKSFTFGGSISNKLTVMTSNTSDFVRSFTLGIASGVLLTPCTSAPLFAALLELTTINNTVHSISALAMLSLGLSAPLVGIAALGNKMMIKPGAWMVFIKNALAGLIIGYAVTLGLGFDLTLTHKIILGVAAGLCGLTISSPKTNKYTPAFIAIIIFIISSSQINKTVNDTRSNELSTISQVSEGVSIVKVQAEWCTNCKANTRVISALDLGETNLYELDITEINEFEESYLNSNNIIGVPTTHFYVDGKLIKSHTGLITKELIENTLNAGTEAK